MATPSSRRAAQRRTARAVRRHERQLPSKITEPTRRTMRQFADDVLSGKIKESDLGPAEKKQLARMAAFSRWQKAPPQYEAAFSKYWYKLKDNKNAENEADRYEEGDESDTTFDGEEEDE